MIGVLIVGHDAGGKSTIASFIESQFKSAYRVAFADPLKSDLYTLGIPVYTKPYSQSVRNLVRQYGETQMTLNGDHYWVNRMFYNMDTVLESTEFDVVICDDCRHLHEFKAWNSRFDKVLTIALLNNNMTELDYNFRAVREVEDLIRMVGMGTIPHSILIENRFTENGLADHIKLTVKEKLDELFIHTSVNSL